MWWTKPARNALLLAACSAALVACAGGKTAPQGAVAQIPDAPTPLDQYGISVSPKSEELALAPHGYGLSDAQRSALAAFARRWREAGTETIVVQAPSASGCGCDPRATARAAATALQGLGVPPSLLRLADYDAAGRADAPVVARYTRYTASADDCSGRWSNLVSTYDNAVTAHFACATTRNMAAMIADPRDLLRPSPDSPADNGRRAVVLDKYRLGQITSSVKDDQANGTVSQAVH